jgi:hypothetical protein
MVKLLLSVNTNDFLSSYRIPRPRPHTRPHARPQVTAARSPYASRCLVSAPKFLKLLIYNFRVFSPRPLSLAPRAVKKMGFFDTVRRVSQIQRGPPAVTGIPWYSYNPLEVC